MKIYCSHSQKVYSNSSNYYQCALCLTGWYSIDPVPMVVIGYTELTEVDARYNSRIEEKNLTQSKFVRCTICKDRIGKRSHVLCNIKIKFNKFITPDSTGRRPYIIFLGLLMIGISFMGIITMGWMVFHR